MVIASYLVLGYLLWQACADPTLSGKPNEYWRCTGCYDDVHALSVYGSVKAALLERAAESVFLAIDTTWTKYLLDPDSKAHIIVVNASTLGSSVISSDVGQIPSSQIDEEFQIVVSEFSGFYKSWSNLYLDLFNGYIQKFTLIPLFPGVDDFLVKNPCFIPINEPFAHKPKSLMNGHDSNIFEMRSGAHSRRKLSEEKATKKMIHKKYAGKHLVLIRLPVFGFHATCVLFTALTKRQFPERCIYDEDHMVVHNLANIGFAHTANTAMYTMVQSSMLKENRIYTMPVAEDYMVRTIDTWPAHHGWNHAWSWAESSTCHNSTLFNDPWACNFLSISNCSNRELSWHLPRRAHVTWETPCKFLREELQITDQLRITYHDAPLFSEERWSINRLKMFMQRPNVWLRHLIRRSLAAVQPLAPASTPAPTGATGAGNVHHSGHASSFSSSTLSAGAVGAVGAGVGAGPLSAGANSGPAACVAMHIRHNDIVLEERRSASKVDRSFTAHVEHVRTLLSGLGTHNIFLATDNATVVEIAADLYPEFTW